MLGSFIDTYQHPLLWLAIVIAFLSALFISMPAHEFAHAHAAYKEGDGTAKALKRYTLAPFSHIDIRGLLLLLLFGIGYAKPVPVDSRNFKNGKKSEVRVALAGVLTNLVLGTISIILYTFLFHVWPELFESYGFLSSLYFYFFQYMISINFMFAFFNILPIYPLDGFRFVETFAKPFSKYVEFMKRYGFLVMLVLLFVGVIDLYINFCAGGLAGLLIEAFDKLFALIFG